MEPKYRMTREENIFTAKRNIIDYIWKSARLEGLAVTYPDTEAIYNGLSVQGLKVSDIVAVNNLKHAWQFVLDTLDYPVDYPFVCKINQYVGGTTWKPDIPTEEQVKAEIAQVNQIESPTDRALTMTLYLVRRQLFLDGNKRTSMLAGNQILISNGCGVLSIPLELQPAFTKLLITFYETNDMGEIKQFLYDNCIDGIDFR